MPPKMPGVRVSIVPQVAARSAASRGLQSQGRPGTALEGGLGKPSDLEVGSVSCQGESCVRTQVGPRQHMTSCDCFASQPFWLKSRAGAYSVGPWSHPHGLVGQQSDRARAR